MITNVWNSAAIFFLALSSSLPLGVLSATRHDLQRRHHNTNYARHNETALVKRGGTNVKMSYYVPETGNEVACGGHYRNADAIVAISLASFDKAAHCGKAINIFYQGTTVAATIVDGCQICPPMGLDLAQDFYAAHYDVGPGMIFASWEFAGAAPAPSPSPTPTPSPSPSPKPSSISSSASASLTSSVAPSSASASATSSGQPTSTQAYSGLNMLDQVFVQMGGVATAAQNVQ
ncbi:hypothetical protein CPB83DRAFT_854451 [Crepidotus variabilis]|uniref:RlpA-like double-psi beta-barrel-protein domain-containing protein-containing protein n=1 Tax=Crepidotus variabilis TaxID=179855 RepID=A0A9P6JPB7_9AGAR|nr:hypothetical protein CPB83DRAFT_854451 [Crepidotus variabilis]